jgi:hypothetical protein
MPIPNRNRAISTDDNDDYVDAIASSLKKQQDNHFMATGTQILTGIWRGEDDVEGETEGDINNLSLVEIEGAVNDNAELHRGVRKLAHVTGLNNGDPVLMVQGPSCPLTIIGELRGDIAILTNED